MQDIAYIHSISGKPEDLKKKLIGNKPSPKIKQLLEINEQRLQNCLRRNLEDSRHYWTIDRIIDSGLRNMKYVQARELMSGKTFVEVDKLVRQFGTWGLGEMLTPVVGENGKATLGQDGQPKLELNLPLFDTVLVPLVLAYRSIRLAKLFDDRNQYPLYKYSPSHKTTKGVVQTDIITSVIQRMSEDMGYTADLKQSILQMLDYGFCLRMPESAWYREEYDTKENGKVVTKTQREGIRFVIPRPERSFIDMSYPVSSLNTDTGPSYLGYWDIKRYGEVKALPGLWQTEKINFGSASMLFHSSGFGIYQELFPCNLKFPTCNTNFDSTTLDREDKQFWYSTGNEDDAACTIAVVFSKLVPKDWGLFDYDKPVWFRFLYGDVGTLLYAEVLPYAPGAMYLYDYDSNRATQNSLTLQLCPFQQLVGNFLTQHVIAVKNNLPRIVWYDTDIVSKEHIQRLKAQKTKMYQEVTFLPFSKRTLSHTQSAQQEAFLPLTFPQANTSELASSIRLTIEILERMLGFPSQEVGQAGAHEQTAKEMFLIADSTSTRVRLTGDGIDEAEKGVKRMVYEGWVNYGSDTVTATIVGVDPKRKKALEEMGFEVEEGDSNRGNTYGVKGKKAAITMSDFASSQEGHTRAQEPKVAIAMMQMLGVALQNPVIFQAVGVDNIVQLLNDVITWSGLPDDFRFKVTPQKGAPPEQQQQQIAQAFEQMKGQILEEAGQMQQQQLMQLAESMKENLVAPMQQGLQAIGQRLQSIDARDEQQEAEIASIGDAIKGLISGLSGITPAPPAGPGAPQLAPMGIPAGVQIAPQALPPQNLNLVSPDGLPVVGPGGPPI